MGKRTIGGRLAQFYRRRLEDQKNAERNKKRRALLQESLETRQLLAADTLTYVIDFVEPGEADQADHTGTGVVGALDPADFGLNASDLTSLKGAVLSKVRNSFFTIPDRSENPASALPDGAMLDLDIVLGDAGAPPVAGASDYYVVQLGSLVSSNCSFAFFCNGEIAPAGGTATTGQIAASIFADALPGTNSALSNGNIGNISTAISQVVSGAIGATLGLRVLDPADVTTPDGGPAIMASNHPAFSPQQRLIEGEFALDGLIADGTARQDDIQKLVDALSFTIVGTGSLDRAPKLISVAPNDGEIFLTGGDPSNIRNTLNRPPTELTFRFDGNQTLDENTLADGIRITRSGDGIFGNGNDVVVQPGFIGFGDTERIVIARFSETLPDDSYRVELFGFDDPDSNITALRNTVGRVFQPASAGGNELDGANDLIETFLFDLELGAQVVAVVPQPVARDSGGNLVQARDQVIVYFNNDDLHDAAVATTGSASDPTVVRPEFYQLLLTRETVSGNDDVVFTPSLVEYDPNLDRAVLTFSDDLDALATSAGDAGGTFRLRIGTNEPQAQLGAPIRPEVVDLLPSAFGADVGSSFDGADGSLGVLAGGATLIRQEIRALDAFPLDYPGAHDEPGHLDTEHIQHHNSPRADRHSGSVFSQFDLNPNPFEETFVDHVTSAIDRVYYNFNTEIAYGENDNNQPLFNNITENQKERAREVFARLGELWGIDFIETKSHVVGGVEGASLTVVTGDLVVFGGTGGAVTSGPGGVFGGVANLSDSGFGAHTFGRTIALLDSGEVWYDGAGVPDLDDVSQKSYYAHAMNVIGSALGVGTASDQPPGTSMSGVIFNDTLGGERDLLTGQPIEPALPGDVDNVHGRHLFRPESRDIDVYRFSIPASETGVFSAEVFAERLENSSSTLDSYLSLYRENPDGSRTLLSTNDDYYSEDAFLELELTGGTYYLAVSASGNDSFDLTVADSGFGGTSEGRYDILFNFRPKADAHIVDRDGTLLDGDADGVAGGTYNYWFRTNPDEGHLPGTDPTAPRMLFVDKSHVTNMSAGVRRGTLANPYRNIDDAFADARRGDIVRIVGNGGLDGDFTTLGDTFAYEVGKDGLGDDLSDGEQLLVPAGVHVMIDAGAVFKMIGSRISVGSSTSAVDRSGSSLQVLGAPFLADANAQPVSGSAGRASGQVLFTSYNNESIGVDTNPLPQSPQSGDWGGIVFRNDTDRAQGRFDLEREGIFLNYVAQSTFEYGGGQVPIDSQNTVINPIHMIVARPTVAYNTITRSADAAMSADSDSFEETNFDAPLYQRNDRFVSDYARVGPDLRGNRIHNNSTNGIFVRVDTLAGEAPQELTVSARWDDTDIVHVVSETIFVAGTPGGPILEETKPPAAGIDPVAQMPSGSAASTLAAGTYTYRITFIDQFGGETVPSNQTRPVTVSAGQQVRLGNLPPATAGFVARRIYRSQPGGQGPFDLVQEIDRSRLSMVDRGQTEGAQLLSVGLQTISDASSTLAPGTYTYRFTFVDSDLAERVVDEVSNPVTVAAGESVRLTDLPHGEVTPNRFSRETPDLRYIYRSNGSGGYELVGITSLSDTAFVDDGSGAPISRTLSSGLAVVPSTRLRARPDARLAIDPAVIVKLEGARFELEAGSQMIAEGVDGQRVIFTSRSDDRHGAGGTFDTNNDQGGTVSAAGDWGGIYASPDSSLSLDYALVRYAGGEVATGGEFAAYNAVEIHQARARIAHSVFEFNASGISPLASQQRDGHGFNEPSVIFVRRAQPTILENVIRDNNEGRTAAISIDVNGLNSDSVRDLGRQTGLTDRREDIRDNQGPLIRGNQLGGNGINGLAIRGGTLTTEVVWDDTDIVHVLADQRPDMQTGPEEIIISDFHTFGGLRLESSPTESLVVKFDSDAGITATGRPLELEDRIGGILQVLGTPGFPVVMTSLSDDSVGAGFDHTGQPQNDTDGSGPSAGSPGDWRSLKLDQFSHDRNVATVGELEPANFIAAVDNRVPSTAQFLGQIATGEKTSDDNLRLGFTVNGAISRPSDIDVYSFTGTAGTEVWLDIDRTSPSLDTIIELINGNGDIIALSDNSHAESRQTLTSYANDALIPPDAVNVLQRDPYTPRNTVDLSFRDDYSTNLRDAGMRVVLPGAIGTKNTYFVRVRSNNQDPSAPTLRDITNEAGGAPFEGGLVSLGKTSGEYQLQIRLREIQEQGGSAIRYADIRYATQGIEAVGVPYHSPLLGEAAEDMSVTGTDGNNTLGSAVSVGALNSSDRAAISIAAQLSTASDVDWFHFRLEPDSVDPLITGALSTPIIIDVDYADGLGRPNTSLWLFGNPNTGGAPRLIAVGTDSAIADDQAGPNQGIDQDDLSRGSAGPLDAWIGSLELTAGDYYLAVTNNSVIAGAISQYEQADVSPEQALLRIEPVSSVARRIGDSLGDNIDQATARPPLNVGFRGDSNRVDYVLSDVTLFVSTPGSTNSADLVTIDPFTGAFETRVSRGPNVADIAMRPDGQLYGFQLPTSGVVNDANYDNFFRLDTGRIGGAQVGNHGIGTSQRNAAGDGAETATSSNGQQEGDGLAFHAITFVGTDGGNSTSAGQTANGLSLVGIGERADATEPRFQGNWIFRLDPQTGAGTSAPGANRQNADVFGNPASGTVVRERGFIDTKGDSIPGNYLAIYIPSGVVTRDSSTLEYGSSEFEFDRGVGFEFQPSAAAPVRDGDFVRFTDDFGNAVTVEFDVSTDVVVTDHTVVQQGDTIDFTLTGGLQLSLEFTADGSVSGLRNYPVDITGVSSSAELIQRIRNAIDALPQNGIGYEDVAFFPDRLNFTDIQSFLIDSPGLASEPGGGGSIAGARLAPVARGASGDELAKAVAAAINFVGSPGHFAAGADGNQVLVGGATDATSSATFASFLTEEVQITAKQIIVDDERNVALTDNDGNVFTVELDTGRSLEILDDQGEFTRNSSAVAVDEGDQITLADADGTTFTFEFVTDADNISDPDDPSLVPLIFATTDTRAILTTRILNAVNQHAQITGGYNVSAYAHPTEPFVIDFENDSVLEIKFADEAATAINGLAHRNEYGMVAGNVEFDVRFDLTDEELLDGLATLLDGRGTMQTFREAAFVNIAGADFATTTLPGVTHDDAGIVSGFRAAPRDRDAAPAEFAESIFAALQASGAPVEVVENIIRTTDPNLRFDSELIRPDGGTITGLTTVDVPGQRPRLYAVSEEGDLYEVVSGTDGPTGDAFSLASSFNSGDHLATIRRPDGTRVPFAGLQAGPYNLEGGKYRQVLFAIDVEGRLYAFDTGGAPVPAFANGQTSIATGASGATGLAFSNLDINLWHQTNDRANDGGHGYVPAPDGNDTREPGTEGRTSFYFGFEDPDGGGINTQAGDWQGIYDVGDTGIVGDYSGNYQTYDFPGGAMGALESDPIDLRGYSAEDLPMLYFSYYLKTENNNAETNTGNGPEDFMLDSLRVFAAGEDGYWQLLATNNSASDRASGNNDERFGRNEVDEYDKIVAGGTEKVSELFDVGDNGAPDSWRQARVSLEDFAGQRDVRIRFEFSTAGTNAIGDINLGGEELRAVRGDLIDAGDTFVVGGETFEFDLGLDLRAQAGVSMPVGASMIVDDFIINFVAQGAPAGPDDLVIGQSMSAEQIADALQEIFLDRGYTVVRDPEQTNRLNVFGPQAVIASPEIQSNILISQPGVAAGRTPVLVHNGMSANQVAVAVQTALAQAFNPNAYKSNVDTFPIRGGNTVRIFGHRVSNPGPLGLSRHGAEREFGVNTTNRFPGNEFGLFTNTGLNNPADYRGQNNAFEGVYLDDIIIGAAERGEMVTGAGPGDTSFIANPLYEPELPTPGGGTLEVDEVETGFYQVEIRRGPGYSVETTDGGINDQILVRSFDANDRFAQQVTLVSPSGGQVFDGQTFDLSDGTGVVTFEFEDATLPPGDPSVGVGPQHVAIRFTPDMLSETLARSIRDAINSDQAQSGFTITAATSEGGPGNTSGQSTSPNVNLFGTVAADRFGRAPSADLNNNSRRDDFIRYGTDLFGFYDVGDQNVFRDQGQILLEGNIIRDSSQFGISAVAGERDRTDLVPLSGILPHPGAPRLTQRINAERLAPSVTIVNNVLFDNGSGGIEISGESNALASGMAGAVPFARVVNNTIVGDGSGDVGIDVSNNASPTILNNILANLQTGISVDGSSSSTVTGANIFQNNEKNSTKSLGTFSVVLGPNAPLFADAASKNYQLARNSEAIDSSLSALADRSALLAVKQPLGIGASPIVAPNRDATGQLRVDDPTFSSSIGVGSNVFIDRGALDRSDFIGPVATLLTPQDNDNERIDQDPNVTYVRLADGTVSAFELLLNEGNGSGPDPSTVTNLSVSLTENGVLLREGIDYTFGFSSTNRTIRLTPLAGIWRPDAVYEITLNNKDRQIVFAADGRFAGDGEQVRITDANGNVATLEYETGFVLQVPQTLTISVPRNGASGITDGQIFSVAFGNEVRTFEFDNNNNFVNAPNTVRIPYSNGDGAEQLRAAIISALNSHSDALNIKPKATGEFDIHLGSVDGLTVDVSSASLTLRGVADGIDTNESFTIEHGGELTTITYDGDAGNTHEEIAELIAAEIRSSIPGLAGTAHLGDGVVQVGGDADTVINVDNSGFELSGVPGVEGSLTLRVAEDDTQPPQVSDGDTFVVSGNGQSITFEFNDVANAPQTTAGNQIINYSPGDSAAAIANTVATAISSAGLGLAATVGDDNVTVRLNEPLGFSVDASQSGLVLEGVGGGAVPVHVRPRGFAADEVAFALVSAINSIGDGFTASARIRGSDTFFLNGASSITGASATRIGAITDIAGNNLQANRPSDETQFTIVMPGRQIDFGDAPPAFPSLLAANGARHVVVPDGPILGSGISAESDTRTDGFGTGDDDDGVDVSDTVFNRFFPSPENPFGTITITASQSGLVDAWIDWNRDSDWNDPNEQILSSFFVQAGPNEIDVPVPVNASPGQTLARVRISSTGQLSPTGLAIDGEVEDHMVRIRDGRPPVAGDAAFDVDEDAAGGLVANAPGLLSGSSDPDGDSFTVHPDDQGQRDLLYEVSPGNFVAAGTIDIAADGRFTYQPPADFTTLPGQPLTFTFRAIDSEGLPSTTAATVTISVNPVNDPPVANDDTLADVYGFLGLGGIVGILEDEAYSFPVAALLANDDPGAPNENDVLSIVPGSLQPIAAGSVAGVDLNSTVSLSADGSEVTIAGAANVSGVAGFTYRIDDNSGAPDSESNTATVLFTVLPVNDSPVVGPTAVSFTIDEDTALNGADLNSILATHFPADPTATPAAEDELSGPSAQGLEIADVQLTSAKGQTVTFDSVAGTFSYTPSKDFFTLEGDPDIVRYSFRDVGAGGGAPVSHRRLPDGTIELLADGAATADGSITISVTPVNDQPVATDDTLEDIYSFMGIAGLVGILEDEAFTFPAAALLANDVSGAVNENETLTIVPGSLQAIAAGAAAGIDLDSTVILSADGSQVTIAGLANASGIAGFRYRVDDGSGEANSRSDDATVTFSVLPVNDSPVLAPNPTEYAIPENTTLQGIDIADVLAEHFAADPNAVPPASDELNGANAQLLEAVSVQSTSDRGQSVTFDPQSGEITYTPAPGFFTLGAERDFIRYSFRDTRSTGDPAISHQRLAGQSVEQLADGSVVISGSIAVSVTPVNEPPAIDPVEFAALEDLGANVTSLLARFNANGGPGDAFDVLTIGTLSGTSAEGGSFQFQSNAAGDFDLAYNPPANGFFGEDTFVFTITDVPPASQGFGPADRETITVTATVTVRPVNDAPTAPDLTFATIEDRTLTISEAQLLAGGAVNAPGLQTETSTLAGNVPQSLALDEGDANNPAVRLVSGPVGAAVQRLPGGGYSVTLPENYFNRDEAGNPLPGAVPLVLSYRVTDRGQSFSVQGDGSVSAAPQLDALAATGTVTVSVFPVNDPPLTGTHTRTVAEDPAGPLLIDASSLFAASPAPQDLPGPGEAAQSLRLTIAPGTVVQTTAGGQATAVDVNNDGITDRFEYTPPANFASASPNGPDTFEYEVIDDGRSFGLNGGGTTGPVADPLSATGTLAINVTPVNDPPVFFLAPSPVIQEDNGETDGGAHLVTIPNFVVGVRPGPSSAVDEANQPVTFTVTGGGSLLTAGPTGQPAISLAGAADSPVRDLQLWLAPDAVGTATITVTATDGAGGDNTATRTFTLTVNGVNDPPEFTVASPEITIDEDAGVQTIPNWATAIRPGPVTAVDEAGQEVSFTVVAQSGAALFSLPPRVDESGQLQFAAAPDASGTAIFSVSASDRGLDTPPNRRTSEPVLLTITINPINDAPVAQNDSFATGEDQQLVIATADILSNDQDADGDTLQVVSHDAVSASGASITVDASGTFTYDPSGAADLQALAAGQTLNDTFTYTISDGTGAGTSEAIVTVTVTGVNDAPVGQSTTVNVGTNRSTVIPVLDFVGDVDGPVDPGTVVVVSPPSAGNVQVLQDGSVSYRPNNQFVGIDSFSIRVRDEQGAQSNVFTFTLNVNEPPVAQADDAATVRTTPVDIDVLGNDSDPDGEIDPSTLTITSQPQHGTASVVIVNGVVLVRYTADSDFPPASDPSNVQDQDEFTYTVRDASGTLSNTAVVRVDVLKSPARNPDGNTDVDGDGFTSPRDALLVINLLNRALGVGQGSLPVDDPALRDPATGQLNHFYDVDGNELVQSLDALRVINQLNRQAVPQSGEGEAALPSDETRRKAAPETVQRDEVVLTEFESEQAAPIFESGALASPLDLLLEDLASDRDRESDDDHESIDEIWSQLGDLQ